MAPVRLPCVAGGDCGFLTVELEYSQAKELLDTHLRYAHPVAAGAGTGAGGQNKPETFLRPEMMLDSSTENWKEFKVNLKRCQGCEADVSFADSFIRFKLIPSPAGTEVKEDDNRNMDETVKMVEAEAMTSTVGSGVTCGNCGKSDHTDRKSTRLNSSHSSVSRMPSSA